MLLRKSIGGRHFKVVYMSLNNLRRERKKMMGQRDLRNIVAGHGVAAEGNQNSTLQLRSLPRCSAALLPLASRWLVVREGGALGLHATVQLPSLFFGRCSRKLWLGEGVLEACRVSG